MSIVQIIKINISWIKCHIPVSDACYYLEVKKNEK